MPIPKPQDTELSAESLELVSLVVKYVAMKQEVNAMSRQIAGRIFLVPDGQHVILTDRLKKVVREEFDIDLDSSPRRVPFTDLSEFLG